MSSWANRMHREQERKKKTERLKNAVLAELYRDENYEALMDDVYEKNVVDIERQVKTCLWACVRVALKDEGIGRIKAQTIMCAADEYAKQHMTPDEFREWCIEETGMDIVMEAE